MALPSSGLITMGMLASEYGIAAPQTLSKFYGKSGAPASGLIRLTDFYGKSNAFTLAITASVASPDVHAMAASAGWNQSAPLIVNISAPYINSLRLDGSKTFAGGITLNIMSGCWIGGVVNGGTAIYARVPVTINNAGTVAGGGGMGGSGRGYYVDQAGVPTSSTVRVYGTGGGGGNGQGFASASSLSITSAVAGGAGVYASYSGEVVGGSAVWARGCDGGGGGSWGQQGGSGSTLGGGYGGTYTTAGMDYDALPGGLGGLYIDGNSFVTWAAFGTRLGRSAN